MSIVANCPERLKASIKCMMLYGCLYTGNTVAYRMGSYAVRLTY